MGTTAPYDYTHLEIDQRDGVLTVRLDRPDDYNAINHDLHTELIALWGQIRRDRQVRAVVLTGNGRAFSAGGNLKGPRMSAGPELDAFFQDARSIIIELLELPQPIIAAVNGPAIGLGATLALMCDVVYASTDAVIADPHVTVGVVAGDGGVVAWPWLTGMARAKEYLLTGDKVGAVEAERIGLVNRVIEPSALLDQAHALAHRLAESPVRAVQGTKAALNIILRDTANLVLDTALATEKECFASGDHARAVEAFLAERETLKAAARTPA
ncbi:enoyl-CoA hydratase/isomerase family protein [Rhodococcus koreensis]|uniref:Enoyl-CoA hydratase n=1 Tax=Rhodococcus koreensis TaxID=99653 RepID=A0A1H5C2E6_9NOCA|nr:enoyl-CoA hydratase/isomerase family protein [Rhodococcus koreensis]SED60460.1 enoyl-CoA hydratase [Rhodococcus koreensis]